MSYHRKPYNPNPPAYNPNDVTTWQYFKPTIIAHDVGRSRDRSTAVIGGPSPHRFPMQPPPIGIGELIELPQGLYGSPRAHQVAAIDNGYDNNTLVIADFSNDFSYAEPLHKLFGPRLIGLQIARHGNGMEAGPQRVNSGAILMYTVGRSYLFELFHSLLDSGQIRFPKNEMMTRAFAQLHALEPQYRDTGTVYHCPEGQHDDLAISCAMLVWAAHHPHLDYWVRSVQASRRPPRRSPKYNSLAWT
jgi:hypothetical protein